MSYLKKYNEFLVEKISMAFQSNYANTLGPKGYEWRTQLSGEKSLRAETLPNFIKEFGEATIEKDELGYYISTSLSSKIPKIYNGVRVIQSYRESLGFEVSNVHSKEEIIFLLEQYMNILMMGEPTRANAANNANKNPDKMIQCLDDIMYSWYDSDRELVTNFFDNFSKKYNHSAGFTKSLLYDINKSVDNWNRNRIDLEAGTLYSKWFGIMRSFNELLKKMRGME